MGALRGKGSEDKGFGKGVEGTEIVKLPGRVTNCSYCEAGTGRDIAILIFTELISPDIGRGSPSIPMFFKVHETSQPLFSPLVISSLIFEITYSTSSGLVSFKFSIIL